MTNDGGLPTTTDASGAGTQRFGRLIERADGRDFPYYNGDPLALPVWQWIIVIASCVAGLAVLYFYPAASNVQSLVPRFLFTAIPLAVFIIFTKARWHYILRRVTGRDVITMVLFAVLNLIITLAVGAVVKIIFGATANTAGDSITDPAQAVAFYLGTAIQLFGEELLTILPFLAVMYICYAKAKISRKSAILIAWLITAVWFGAIHLPSYGWNVAQALLVIGVARLVLTLAYIRTKNILVSTGAHIINDWVLFTFPLITSAAAVII